METKNILSEINYGQDEIAPVVFGLMAQNKSFMIIGRHGAGKTRLIRFISKGLSGLSDDGFVYYDATKDDLVSVAGIPDPDAMKKGDLRFLKHNRTIWDKKTIVVDEISRANKESQNMWLEILEEKTCFGLPLQYKSIIALSNPESYAATARFDEALLDRFYAVIPIPENQSITQDGFGKMFDLNFVTLPSEANLKESLLNLFSGIRNEYNQIRKDSSIIEKIKNYCSAFTSHLLNSQHEKENPLYISPRTYSRNFPETFICIASYYKYLGDPEFLEKAADFAIRYSLAAKMNIEIRELQPIHESFISFLKGESCSDINQVRLEIGRLFKITEKISYLNNNMSMLKRILPIDEIEKFISSIFQQINTERETEKLIELYKTLGELKEGHDESYRKVKGKLIVSLHSAIPKVQSFLNHLKESCDELSEKEIKSSISEFLGLSSNIEELICKQGNIEKLTCYVLRVYDGNDAMDENKVKELF
ncbi:MAG: AAA family ATPase [Desulfobacterales bacterium]|nr:AAA family ATPase [Desulfobacterales bacterium]